MLTSILDLPTELILEIIIYSDDPTDAIIVYLGMTCRRLHDICQVLVLERQLPVLRALASRGRLLIYKNSGSIAMKDEELDDVKEIFQASFHKIKYIPITFSDEEIASIHRLIFHANAVGYINITLDLLPYSFGLPENTDWYKPLASLIRVSSEKDMASLTITGIRHRYFTPLPIPKTPSSPVKKKISIFSLRKDRFFGHNRRPGGIGTQPDLQVNAPKSERLPDTGVYFGTPQGLKSFEIHSPFLFQGACFPQTLRALNGGYLTKLSFQDTRLCISDWGNILPLLSMPLLSEFHVGDSDIAFCDLSPFLMRHSSITHLDLSRSRPIGPIMPPKGLLPHLEVMNGNPDYLVELLSSWKHLFPELRSIALTTQHPMRAIQHGSFDNILRKLTDRKRGTIHLSLEFSQPASLSRYFSKAKSKPYSSECVKTLEIITFEKFPISCLRFFSWVSVKFPYVQELDLKRVVSLDLNMWTRRLDALWDSCPELRSVIIGVETYQRPAKATQ